VSCFRSQAILSNWLMTDLKCAVEDVLRSIHAIPERLQVWDTLRAKGHRKHGALFSIDQEYPSLWLVSLTNYLTQE